MAEILGLILPFFCPRINQYKLYKTSVQELKKLTKQTVGKNIQTDTYGIIMTWAYLSKPFPFAVYENSFK